MKRLVVFLSTIFLLSVSIHAALTIKPVVPTPGQEGVTLGTQIVLQFGENVAEGTGACYLNGEAITTSRITGNMVFIRLNQLDYDTYYTVDIKQGAFVSKSNGAAFPALSYTFSTIERPAPENRLFDAIVAQDGSGNYTSVRAAVKAAPTGRTKPWLIFVKNGVYNELIRVSKDQKNICLIGEDMEKTIIKFKVVSNRDHEFDQSNFPEAEGQGPVVAVNGDGFFMHNMTVFNSFGYENQAGPQALALGSYADRFLMFNTKLYSFQDTWQTGRDEHRHYAKRCYIEGAVDFIYCSGEMILDSCTLGLCRTGSVIVAPSHGSASKYGYVFRNCHIVSSKPGVARPKNSFGRPWHNTPMCSYINTTLSKDISFSPEGWTDHMGGLPKVFAEYNTMNYLGQPVDLSKRITRYWRGGTSANPEETCTAKAILTKEEADQLTIGNVLRGTDNWRPEDYVVELPAPKVTFKGNKLTWEKERCAICYMVMYQGQFKAFTTECNYQFSEGKSSDYRVRAVGEYGTLGFVSAEPQKATSLFSSQNDRLNVDLQSGALTVNGFDGEAEVRCYGLSGEHLAHYRLSNGQTVQLVDTQSVIVKVSTRNETKVIKCVM